jgi:integrase
MKAVVLDRVEPRTKLRCRRDPYWVRLAEGRYLGFRRMVPSSPGSWVARLFDGEKRHFQPLGDFDDLEPKERYDAAKRAAEEWFGHVGTGGATKPGTVRSACEAYVTHLRAESSEAAAKDAEGRFRRLVNDDPIARIDLAKLGMQHVSAWRTRALKAAGSEASFNRNATALRAALNLAKDQGKVPTDLAWSKWLKPIKDAGEPRTQYLTLDERAKLIQSATEQARPFFTALALLPLRPGELASLQVQHLNARGGMLRVPKGKTSWRDVPLSAEALEHFKECAKGKLPQAWLVSRGDGSQWKKEAWRDEVKEAAHGAKLPSATVAYTLRHSVITDLVVGGLDLFTVAKLAGTSVAMIEKTYGKLRAEHARNALQGLSLKPRVA